MVVDVEDKNKVYLIIFELWRRLNGDKQAISIFCDELDRRIFLYEKDTSTDDLYEYLKNMLEILDRNMDLSDSSEELFTRLSSYLAHDIEQVFYTYIEGNIACNEDDCMIDLIEGLMPYVRDKRRLWFLKLKTISDVFPEEKKTFSIIFS